MKKFNLVPSERKFIEDTLEINPIGFSDDGKSVQMYIKTSNHETSRVIYEMNQTIPMEAFILLNDPEANFDAINEFLIGFDVKLAPIEVIPTIEPEQSTTTVQPSL
jgi:hypothetical protein